METLVLFSDIISTQQIQSFHIRVARPGWSYPSHHHNTFELLHCLDGQVYQELGDQRYPFQSGDWLLIPPGIKHSVSNSSSLPYTYFSFRFDIDDQDLRCLVKVQALISKEKAVGTLLSLYFDQLESLLLDYLNKANPTIARPLYHFSFEDRLFLQAHMLLIVREIIHLLKNEQNVSLVGQNVSSYETNIAHQIEGNITNTLHEPDISVEHIANQVGLSRAQCTRIFTKIYGISPRQFITSLRLRKAKEELINSNMSIEMIAEKLGFSSSSHFSKQFKRLTGLSPQQYRPKQFIGRHEKIYYF